MYRGAVRLLLLSVAVWGTSPLAPRLLHGTDAGAGTRIRYQEHTFASLGLT